MNTETNRRLANSGIYVIKYIFFLDFHLKVFFKNSCSFSKLCPIINIVENIIGGNFQIGYCSVIEGVDVDIMINCAFLLFNNCDHFIKEYIPLSFRYFCFLNSIHVLKKKWTIISIERNIGVIYFKSVYIIGWCNDIKSFMNGNICILKLISDI